MTSNHFPQQKEKSGLEKYDRELDARESIIKLKNNASNTVRVKKYSKMSVFIVLACEHERRQELVLNNSTPSSTHPFQYFVVCCIFYTLKTWETTTLFFSVIVGVFLFHAIFNWEETLPST